MPSTYAGATADAFTLLERLEAKLERHPGQLMRACVELAKDWRTDHRVADCFDHRARRGIGPRRQHLHDRRLGRRGHAEALDARPGCRASIMVSYTGL
jgi:hypothetical protein